MGVEIKTEFKAIRESMGISQRELALLIGASVDSIQNWDQGRRSAPSWAMNRLKQLRAHAESIHNLLAWEREQIHPKAKSNIFNILIELVLTPKSRSSRRLIGARVFDHLVNVVRLDIEKISSTLLKYVSCDRAIQILTWIESSMDADGPEIKGPPPSEMDAFLIWRELDRLIYHHSDLARYERLYLIFLENKEPFTIPPSSLQEFWQAIRDARRRICRLLRDHLLGESGAGWK